MHVTDTQPHSRQRLRSAAALFLGFIVVFILSLGTDQLLHMLEVYPPWGQPMNDTGDNLLALAYRIVYAVIGSYIAARLAPHSPMRHALALGIIGLVLSIIGAVAAINMNLGPSWYPIALVLTALPCAWLGGVLHRKRQSAG
jgi:surface polysaccharide O-acyltransferase-like enzyme